MELQGKTTHRTHALHGSTVVRFRATTADQKKKTRSVSQTHLETQKCHENTTKSAHTTNQPNDGKITTKSFPSRHLHVPFAVIFPKRTTITSSALLFNTKDNRISVPRPDLSTCQQKPLGFRAWRQKGKKDTPTGVPKHLPRFF
jgi:hypothetical protein